MSASLQPRSKSFRYLAPILAMMVVLSLALACGARAPAEPPTATPVPSATPAPTETPVPATDTPVPTATLAPPTRTPTTRPTYTPYPTYTPFPTWTPPPSPTAVPEPTEVPTAQPVVPTAVPAPKPPAPAPVAAGAEVTINARGYEQWGHPVGNRCDLFDNSRASRKFNVDITITNNSAETVRAWYPVFYAHTGRELLTCWYLYGAGFPDVPVGKDATVTFACFAEPDEYVSEVRIPLPGKEERRCFSPEGVPIACL